MLSDLVLLYSLFYGRSFANLANITYKIFLWNINACLILINEWIILQTRAHTMK